MKKKVIFILIIFFVISLFIFAIFEYKHKVSGNNISVSDSIDILNISSYQATVTVTVNSNKNTNKYVLIQKYALPNISSQEVIEPSNIKGIKIIQEGNNVTLENSTLELKTVYDNFNGDISALNLMSFINKYKEGKDNENEENDEEIIMKTKINKNKYQMYQDLYISKKTNLPTKMEILDVNKNGTVYILYNEIKVNKTTRNDIVD